MKVYLGGKMSGHDGKSNWRHSIVSSVDVNFYQGEYFQAEGCELSAGCGAGEPPDEWPIMPNAIFGKHDYVGPYLVGCDHGCFHTGDHATSIGGWEDETAERTREFREDNRAKIAKLCQSAMSSADVLFFWFDSLDAYGTLAELVYISASFGMLNLGLRANGRDEIEKHIFIASPSFDAIDEMWLAFHLIEYAVLVTCESPAIGLARALSFVEKEDEYSPIEKMFIRKWRTTHGNGIVPQYNVPGFPYRVDFAFPDDKVAVELDGYEYHNSKDQFTNDRKRQREMEGAGWRFIRFSGSEVYNNAEACVHQTYEFWQSLTQAKV